MTEFLSRIRQAQDDALVNTINQIVSEQSVTNTPSIVMSQTSSDVFPVEQFIAGGTIYSTMHKPDPEYFPDLYVTAFHAFDPSVAGALEEQYGTCFTLKRSEVDTQFFLDPTPDVHFFAPDVGIVEEFKKNCPDPDVISRQMGFGNPNDLLADGEPTIITSSHPAGHDDGPPQNRLLSPYYVTNQNSTSGLHTFYSHRADDPSRYGVVVGGNSGGKSSLIDSPSKSIGVLVRAGSDDQRRQFAVVQPFNSNMELVRTV